MAGDIDELPKALSRSLYDKRAASHLAFAKLASIRALMNPRLSFRRRFDRA
jgi:hypothetical protein